MLSSQTGQRKKWHRMQGISEIDEKSQKDNLLEIGFIRCLLKDCLWFLFLMRQTY